MASELTHTRSCGYYDSQEGCTCCLRERIEIQTEREMHNAWRKRAEEAESNLASLTAQLAQCREATVEECAKVCDDYERDGMLRREYACETADEIAARIRALSTGERQ